MVVLLVTPTPTHPANAGNRARVCALADAMRSLGVDLHVAYVRREQGADESGMVRHWGPGRFHPIDSEEKPRIRTLRKRILRSIRWRLRMPIPDEPYRIDAWCGDGMMETFRSLVGSIRPDIVWIEYVFLSRLFETVPQGTLRILDTHDVFAHRHKMMRALGKEPEWFFTTPSEERKGCRRADIVVAIQNRERVYFSEKYKVAARTIGHFVETSGSGDPTTSEPTFVFIGSGNRVNRDGIEWFVREVWPMIHHELPQARLEIYGDCGHVFDGQRIAGVDVLGRIDSLDSAYQRAWVVVAPLRMGTGLKIKSIEALARGKALVATPCAAEGMEDAASTAFLMAGSAGDFARACVRTAQSTEDRHKLEEAAFRYAVSWNDDNLAGLRDMLHGKTGGHPASRGAIDPTASVSS